MLIELSAITAAVGAVWKTIEEPAKHTAKKLGEKLVGDKVGEAVKGVKRRLVAQLPLPRNHDLVRGLRTDYLSALQKALDYYKADLRSLPAWEVARPPSDAEVFAKVVQGWLDARIHPVTGKGADHHAVTEADVEAVLDHVVHPSSTEGFARQAASARGEAERRALAEIGEAWGDEIPPRFVLWFKGRKKQPGWYDLFALYVAERIKTNERFRAIFVAAELVDIKGLLKAVDRRIAETNAGIGRVEQTLGLVTEKLNSVK